MPWARMSLVTLARSTVSASGDQMNRSTPLTPATLREPAGQLSADQHAPDLRGAGTDRVELRVPEEAAGRHLVQVPGAAHSLDRLERDLHGSLRRREQARSGGCRVAPIRLTVEPAGDLVSVRARGLDRDEHV